MLTECLTVSNWSCVSHVTSCVAVLMPTMSAFSEQPSVVDMDVFALIVSDLT